MVDDPTELEKKIIIRCNGVSGVSSSNTWI